MPRDTRYGINANDTAGVEARLAVCGGIGVARVYYTRMLPTTWDASKEGASPQAACQVSFKAEPADVAAGQHDATIVSWVESIPAGWLVYLTFWHEPNDELRDGRFSAQSYRAAWSRLSTLVRRQTRVRDGATVRLVPNFMAYQVGVDGQWSDDWVPRPNEVDFVSWDIYGNPTGGDGLSGGYPPPQGPVDPCLRASGRLGFASWGISEFNTPARSWDADESARRSWLTDFHAYAVSTTRQVGPQLGAPRIMLLWEGNGVNWDQTFETAATWAWWRQVITSDALNR
ncbi:MAG: hypothetical protein H0V07_06900 [Propionibacteriales bacterium]|nr:hypothetical protein [Propionibacteriales bacterium]